VSDINFIFTPVQKIRLQKFGRKTESEARFGRSRLDGKIICILQGICTNTISGREIDWSGCGLDQCRGVLKAICRSGIRLNFLGLLGQDMWLLCD
jgi:hypothetical protein